MERKKEREWKKLEKPKERELFIPLLPEEWQYFAVTLSMIDHWWKRVRLRMFTNDQGNKSRLPLVSNTSFQSNASSSCLSVAYRKLCEGKKDKRSDRADVETNCHSSEREGQNRKQSWFLASRRARAFFCCLPSPFDCSFYVRRREGLGLWIVLWNDVLLCLISALQNKKARPFSSSNTGEPCT